MNTDTLLQFFDEENFRPELQAIAAPFRELADWLIDTLDRNPERTVALRKLLEARDAAVRAVEFRPLPR